MTRDAAGGRLEQLGRLGRLDELAGWVAGVQGAADPDPDPGAGAGPPRPFERVRMLVLAGDHSAPVSPVSPVARLAAALDVGVRVAAVPAGEDSALTRAGVDAALQAGRTLVDQEVDAGADLLVVACAGRADGIPASALIGLLTRSDPSLVTSRGSTIDDALWMRRCAAVRDTMRRGRPVKGDQAELLAAVGGADLAVATGVLLQAATRRTPVLLDGVVTTAAALVAHRIAFRAVRCWLAGHRSPEPAHDLALDRLGLVPLLDLGIRAEDGTGALLAVPVLRAAAALR